MKKLTIILASLFLAFSFTSCNDNESLQSYLVKSQEKKGYITFDVPASILQVKSDQVSAETKETLNTLKKINIVAMLLNDNAEELLTEKVKIETILKNDDYKSLMRFTEKGIKVNLYYTGTGDAIDEVIAFGYAADKGVGLARILGDKMNPARIMKMMNDIKLDSSGISLDQFSALFSAKK
jgi:hypothetical protein